MNRTVSFCMKSMY